MIRNYLVSAVRTLRKEQLYAVLNISGLALGIACSLLITLYVKDESGFDRFHDDTDNIYRVAMQLQSKSNPVKYFAVTAAPLAAALKNDFPEISHAIRLVRVNLLMRAEDRRFYEPRLFFADQDFFSVFSFRLIKGDPKMALNDPFQIVITEAMAEKYFGQADPVGKMMMLGDTSQVVVSGVVQNPPANSHFHFDLLVSFKTFDVLSGGSPTSWWNHGFYTYIKTSEGSSPSQLQNKVSRITEKYTGDVEKSTGFKQVHFLQPLKDIHLHSDLRAEIEPNGSMTTLYIFSGIAAFILIIASVNYMNLSTARSSKRSKEVGMRKVAGASRSQLMGQFLGESVLMSLVSLIFALLLMELVLPFFNDLTGKNLSILKMLSLSTIGSLLVFSLLLGIVAGSYPAFFLSSFKTLDAVKHDKIPLGKGLSLRKLLVVFQFTLSIILITGTMIAWKQLDFMLSQKLGLDKEQLVVIPMRDQEVADARAYLKEELKKNAAIINAASSSSTPGRYLSNITVLPEGAERSDIQTMQTLILDHDFLNTYKIKLLAGRDFSKEFLSDDSAAFMLNESAVQELGWGSAEAAIGKKFEWGLGKEGRVIGVTGDFHFNSLKGKIAPVVMHIMRDWDWNSYLSVRVASGKIEDGIKAIREVWSLRFPNHPFEYYFADSDFDNQYQADIKFSAIATVFSIVTIVVACLGLFGLASYTAEKRTKEIGIRKTFGATVGHIVGMMSVDFLKLVLIAFLVAVPIAWWAIVKWLEDFPYRVDVGLWAFALAGFFATLIALLTISFQSIKAALANPVNSLRNE